MRIFLHSSVVFSVVVFLAACAGPDPEIQFQSNLSMAKLGNMEAQVAVAEAYRRGIGVPKNYLQSIAWYKRASDNGCADCASKAADVMELQAIDWMNSGKDKLKSFLP